MKNLLLILLLISGINNSFAQQKISKGNITEKEIDFLSSTLKWKDSTMVIHFLQPKKNCHYNNYKNLKGSRRWYKDYNSKINALSAQYRFVYSDASAAENVIDNKVGFPDTDDFFLSKFFNKTPYCHAVMVINRKGSYILKDSEYSDEEITEMINSLKS